jgi:hypothetical protein
MAEMMPTIRSNLPREGFLLLSIEPDIMLEFRQNTMQKRYLAIPTLLTKASARRLFSFIVSPH